MSVRARRTRPAPRNLEHRAAGESDAALIRPPAEWLTEQQVQDYLQRLQEASISRSELFAQWFPEEPAQ